MAMLILGSGLRPPPPPVRGCAYGATCRRRTRSVRDLGFTFSSALCAPPLVNLLYAHDSTQALLAF